MSRVLFCGLMGMVLLFRGSIHAEPMPRIVRIFDTLLLSNPDLRDEIRKKLLDADKPIFDQVARWMLSQVPSEVREQLKLAPVHPHFDSPHPKIQSRIVPEEDSFEALHTFDEREVEFAFQDRKSLKIKVADLDADLIAEVASRIVPAADEYGLEWALYRYLNTDPTTYPEEVLEDLQTRVKAWRELGYSKVAEAILKSEGTLSEKKVFSMVVSRMMETLERAGEILERGNYSALDIKEAPVEIYKELLTAPVHHVTERIASRPVSLSDLLYVRDMRELVSVKQDYIGFAIGLLAGVITNGLAQHYFFPKVSVHAMNGISSISAITLITGVGLYTLFRTSHYWMKGKKVPKSSFHSKPVQIALGAAGMVGISGGLLYCAHLLKMLN